MLLLATARANAGHVTVVALSGQQAADGPPGMTYESFDAQPVINGLGEIAFRAALVGGPPASTRGLYTNVGGTISEVARYGEQAPGLTSGVVFGTTFTQSLGMPVINDAGEILFWAGVVGQSNNTGLWQGPVSAPQLIFGAGLEAPGVPDSEANMNFASAEKPGLNPGGEVVLRSRMVIGAGGVTVNNLSAMWAGVPGSLEIFARRSSQAPDTPEGVIFDLDQNHVPRLNASGDVAIWHPLKGEVTSANDAGIWVGPPTNLSLVAREDEPAPAPPPGARFESFNRFNHGFNDEGEVAFSGFMVPGPGGVTADDNAGVWLGLPGALALVAREGELAPGAAAGLKFSEFSPSTSALVLGAGGHLVIPARLDGPGANATNKDGLWALAPGGSLEPVAVAGQQLPTAPMGYRFVQRISNIYVNVGGESAFVAHFDTDGDGQSDGQGLWTYTSGTLGRIAIEGLPFTVAPGDVRTVDRIIAQSGFHRGSGGTDGLGTALNDAGQLTFALEFTDGSAGVFVADIRLNVEQLIQQISDEQQIIIDADPNSPLADKLEDAQDKLNTALAELAKNPPDNQAAAGIIEGAIGDIQAAVDDLLLDPAVGTQMMDDLAGAARLLVVHAIDDAIALGGDPDEILLAQMFLADGDDFRFVSMIFKDAAAAYKDAIAKAEGA